MLRASIDIGSNSILLLIANVEQGKIVEVIENESRVTGLGRDLDINRKFIDINRKFIDIAIDESLSALKEYAELISNYKIDKEKVIVTATEASRVAINIDEFIELVYKETSLKVLVITGEAEAYFSTVGILLGAGEREKLTIMDIGGASTEIIHYSGGNIELSYSMPTGAVRYTNWLEQDLVNKNLLMIEEKFKDELARNAYFNTLYCVAGTMTSVGNMYLNNNEFIEDEVHGLKMNLSDIIDMNEKFANFTPEDFLIKFPFLGKRSKTIKAGLQLAIWICKILKISDIEISTYGLRYGTLIIGSVKNEYLFK